MATVGQDVGENGQGIRSSPASGRHWGQGNLAEVIMIRPARAPRTGLLGSLVTMARVFVFPRAQATSVRSTPRPPSSPAPLSVLPPRAPHDAA